MVTSRLAISELARRLLQFGGGAGAAYSFSFLFTSGAMTGEARDCDGRGRMAGVMRGLCVSCCSHRWLCRPQTIWSKDVLDVLLVG